jgi:hypothetical protein
MQNGYAANTGSTSHCNFDGDDCWTVRTHPKIESVSAPSGYTTGGQEFTISGHGLNGTDVSVLVDGVACEVTEALSGAIQCVTGAKDTVSALGYQPGQPGLKREKTLEEEDYSTVDLLTSMEVFEVDGDIFKEQISGWFTAPTDGLYRFYISCDDACNLSLDSTTPYAGTPLAEKPVPELIASRSWSTNWRSYFYNKDEGQKSEWIFLTQGQQYYIMAESTKYDNMDHMTVSLEIKPEVSGWSHPKASKTMQQLSFDQENTFEQWNITISAPDQGTYKVNFLNPTTDPPSLW